MRRASIRARSAGSDPIDDLIESAFRLQFEDLSPAVIHHQKRRLLDNIACALAGCRADGVQGLLEMLREEGGSADSATVIGLNAHMSVRNGAMLGSLMARAWDYCDVISPGYHPSSTDVPIALAVGEYCRSTGPGLLAAMAAGQDVAVRINAAAQKTGFLYNGFDSNILAPISGAIIAGRLLGLTLTQLREAVGLAANTSAGSFQAVQDRVLAVRLAQANATRNAVESALLARAGFTGIRRVLGGELSFFRLFAQRTPDWDELTRSLGENQRGSEVTCFKLYPSCGVTLALTDAALEISREDDLQASSVRRGQIRVSPTMNMLCGGQFNAATASEVDAMFSVQYVAANALVRRASRLEHFIASAIREPSVAGLAERLEVLVEPAFGGADECELRIETESGAIREIKSTVGKGWPQNPLTDVELTVKLSACLEFSGLALPSARAGEIASACSHFEAISDLRSFVCELLV